MAKAGERWLCATCAALFFAASPAYAQLDGGVVDGAVAEPSPPPEEAPPEEEPATEEEPTTEEGEEEAPTQRGPITYTVERVRVRGNTRTDTGVIRSYVNVRDGEVLDVEDPRLESIEWRLLGTGWFDEVHLTFERARERGHVVLVVEVRERNTFIVQSLALGFSEGVLNSLDPDTSLEPYFGISVAELNLFGTGVSMEATALLSVPQQGVRLRAGQASAFGSEWGLTGMLFFNNGREFFGNDDVVFTAEECPIIGTGPCEEALNAVVEYRRYGGSIGTGYDIANTVRFTLDYHLEAVEVVNRPPAASHTRGTEVVPINFGIHDGLSWISSIELGVTHDERDDPGLPTQGRLMFLRGDLSGTIIGSDYNFVRIEGGWREWIRLPEWRHTLRFGLFLGAAFGDVPFFYKFYVADLSDLIPSRVLELNLDRRVPPNFLDTSVIEMRAEDLAGRIDIEYAIWLYEGNDGFRGLQAFASIGLYALADSADLRLAIPGYEGFARVPLDLTFDFGVRLDTLVGVFEIGFSTLLGFISLEDE